MSFELYSPAFESGQTIPLRYTGDGEDVSPPLRWRHLPEGTAQLALICDDPDAPTPQPWVHWVLYCLDPQAPGVAEGLAPLPRVGAPHNLLQGENSWGRAGYGGPAPPRGHGLHHYRFTLYALQAPLDLPPSISRDALVAAMKGHILGYTTLEGTYQR